MKHVLIHLPRPRALLFDLDGTLVDSRRDIAEALNSALAALGLPRLALDVVATMIGDGARLLVRRGLAFGRNEPDEALVDRGVQLFTEAYLAAPCVHTTLLPGVADALTLGLPCGLVTNKPRDVVRLVLDHLAIASAFAAFYGGGDGPLKPAPDGILRVCGALGVAPVDTWFIGDGPQDVLAGKAAGATTIAVPGIADEAHVRAADPDVVLGTMEELRELLASSQGR